MREVDPTSAFHAGVGESPTVESRFATEFREVPVGEPGLVLEDDGTVKVVLPDGTREVVGGGGSSPVQNVAVPVSSAEILNLTASPKTIIAAPGAGKVVVPIAIFTVVTFVTTMYTLTGGAPPLSWLGYLAEGQYVQQLQGLDSPSSTETLSAPMQGGTPESLGSITNQPFVLGSLGSDVTDGDGTVVIYVSYVTLG